MIAAWVLAAAAGVTCPFDAQQFRSAHEIRARISRTAEAVAPSGGRRRTASPPQIAYPPGRNFVDAAIFGQMKSAAIHPAPRSADAEFLRRITIDLAGRIPRPDEVSAFLADASDDKRDRAIDRLLASDDFNDRWTIWFGDLVQNAYTASDVGQGVLVGVTPYYRWIRAAMAKHQPYDAMVRELLTSDGEQIASPASNYFVRVYQENGPPQDTYDNVATQSGTQFLGEPMNCVSCHDGFRHLEQLNKGMSHVKRRQLWALAAFFSRIKLELQIRGQAASYVVSEAGDGDYRLDTTTGNKSPRTAPEGGAEIVEPEYLDGGKPADGENRRAAYARMLTADPQFARAAVNYLWKEMFGLGIVEPVNNFDLDSDTQATHPALLNELATYFVQSGFDLRALLRVMAQSNAYQLSGRYDGTWSETFTPYFARHYPRRMMAEIVLDALYQATGRQLACRVASDYGVVTKAVATPDPNELVNSGWPQGLFLISFGEGDRDSNARSAEPSLLQVLEMLNDRQILDGLQSNTLVSSLVAKNNGLQDVVDQLYVAALSRPPTDAERAIAVDYLKGGPLAERAPDLQFVLLNKLEFLFY
ncbi:MAG TPA: DUF1549 domain-containing protein [Thermoanaerobaculia bacterium]|nr:DUF1549 domain-containing protein [Thermoanaerobaculia bacterium]